MSRLTTTAVAVASPMMVIEALEERHLLAWGPVPLQINLDDARTNYPSITGQGVTIVNIDAGINLNHPSLQGQLWVNPTDTTTDGVDQDASGVDGDKNGWNFIANTSNVHESFPAEWGHGTETGGIIVAKHFVNTGNVQGYAGDGKEYEGIASGAKLISLKVSHIAADGQYINFPALKQALDWTVRNRTKYNIVAVNMSLGGGSFADYTTYMKTPIQTLHDAGVVIACASGNTRGTGQHYPANDPHVLGVGGADIDDTVTYTTSRGSYADYIDMLAPGNKVMRLNLDTGYFEGGEATSDATPMITATAALIKQIKPSFTVAEVKSILQDSGVPIVDDLTGRTYKRLDVHAALQLATQRANPQTPFTGTPIAIPGVFQAENFDNGGQGIAYSDTTSNNEGPNGNRVSGVDMQTTTDAGGGYNVGWTHNDEWLEYTVNVATSGSYDILARVAHNAAGATFHVEIDGVNVTGTVAMPNTGGTQTFQTLTAKTGVQLAAGQHVVRVVVDAQSSNGYAGNFNWFEIRQTPPPPSTQTPFSGTPIAAPGIIQVEDFDNGGEGIAYHDLDTLNSGGDYRTTGVDIDITTDAGGGYMIGWSKAGEWLEYTINVASAGTYDVLARVANTNTGGKFHIEIDGVNVTGAVNVPNTGGWQTFQTLTAASGVQLSAGTHVLRLAFDTLSSSGVVANVNWLELKSAGRNARQPLEAEDADASQGVTEYTSGSPGYIGYTDQGDWLRFDNVDFGTGVTQFITRIATDAGHAGRRVQVRLDSLAGTVVGSLTVAATGPNGDWGTWAEQSVNLLTTITGVHTLYITFDGGTGVGNIDWFKFA